jgi:L-lactate dehydrogenase (L-LDH)
MNDDLRELQKEELLAKLKELQAFLVKESDESISKADPHKPFKDYYEGAFRAYELAVYKMYDIFGLEPPEGWGKTTSPKLENFSPPAPCGKSNTLVRKSASPCIINV